MARLQDIAEQAGVSKVAVSCVLNNRLGNVRVSEFKQLEIRRIAREVGYIPNLRAKGMAYQKSFTIGLVAPCSYESSDYFIASVNSNYIFRALMGVESACREAGYHCIYTSYGVDEVGKLLYPRAMQDASVDGVILMGRTRVEAVDTITSFNVPCVQIGSNVDSECRIEQVYGDLDHAFEEIVSWLAALGHRKISLCLPAGPGPRLLAKNFLKLTGKIKGIRTEVVMGPEGADYVEQGCQYSQTVLADNDPPSAFIGDIINVKGLAEGLTRGGWRCPENYSLVAFSAAFGGLAGNAVTEPLTTILLPQYEVGRLAARKLLEKLGAIQLDSEELCVSAVPCEIIYGASIGSNPKAR